MNQNCPTLILSAHNPVSAAQPPLTKDGVWLINIEGAIATYHAYWVATAFPRGS